jgi:hypothetical protein
VEHRQQRQKTLTKVSGDAPSLKTLRDDTASSFGAVSQAVTMKGYGYSTLTHAKVS